MKRTPSPLQAARFALAAGALAVYPLRPAPAAGQSQSFAEAASAPGPTLETAGEPKVRTVTAFVRLERARLREQIAEAVAMLGRARAAYEAAGYEVQSVRISTQPFPEYAAGLSRADALSLFRRLDSLSADGGFALNIGPAMASDPADPDEADLLGDILVATGSLSGSVAVAGPDGVHWEAVLRAARIMRRLADETPGGIGNFNFGAESFVPADTPFYPASYSARGGPGRRFAVGLQSANTVAAAFAGADGPDDARARLKAALGGHARRIEAIAWDVEARTGWAYAGLDLSPAPMGPVSIGAAIESLIEVPIGSPGTLSAAALITSVLRDLPVQRAGYSGLMIPVLEDSVLARRWSEGTLTLQGLLAYSSVCASGLDTVPLPGDVTVEELARIIGDVASLAVRYHKPLTARLMPVPGKAPGDRTEFDSPFIRNVTLHPVR
ncbi:MAG: DUF711 family protein [Gemmatimonadota bacterium]